jgi:Chaperone of endosialidase
MNTSGIRGFFVGVIVVTGSLSVLAMTIPKTFVAGQPIKASDVNLNFTAVKTAVDTLELKALRFGTVATGVNAVAGLKLTNTGTGNGLVSTTSGTAFGTTGVAGYNLGTTDFTVGVYGEAKASQKGTGVKGIGGLAGGYFEAVGNGLLGLTPTGVIAVATKGIGVNAKGITGLIGTGTSVGVKGFSSGNTETGYGVLGTNTSATGKVVGVLGQATNSPDGTGVVGKGRVNGGYFEAVSNGTQYRGTGVSGFGNIGVSGLGSYRGVEGVGGDVAVSAINKAGGFLYLGSNASGAVFEVLDDGTVRGKAFTVLSDRNAKTNFSSVNALTVLEKVTHLPIQRWNYKDDSSSLQHVGPMAQDFHAAFGLNGSDDKHISTVDVQGVALAAIQGLNQKLEQKDARINSLESKLAALATRLEALEKK